MGVIFAKEARDVITDEPHTLALDLTDGVYTLQLDGQNVTAAAEAGGRWDYATLTAGAAEAVLSVEDIGGVGFSRPSRGTVSKATGTLAALGRLAVLSLGQGVPQTAIFGGLKV